MAFESINEVSDRELHILWTNADPVAAENMVFMYSRNSILNGWWDRITVIAWGPTQTLILDDPNIRARVRELRELGIHVSACLTCADKMGLTGRLEQDGIEVVRWGKRLTELLQSRKHVLSV